MKLCPTKLWKIMKICAAQAMIAMIICGICLAHDSHAQILQTKISISAKQITLKAALYEIQNVSGLRIHFSIESIEYPDQLVDVEARNESLEKVLNNLLLPRGIAYRVDEQKHAIIILKKSSDKKSANSNYPPGITSTYDKLALISGTITDAKSKQPLAGVNILVKGTTNGTTSDSDGNYRLNMTDGNTLTFSFIGYAAHEETVDGRTRIDVEMTEDITSLGEVVVYSTGYSEEAPEKTTGSYSNIGKDLLERNVGSDLFSRLNGVTPSLLLDQRNGTQRFLNIRGRSTIMANDQPLIVVDNFPYNGDLNTINPNDIESITILRDAAAASIWGVRAGNGVIVVTTKKGIKNQPFRINLNSNVSVGDRPDLFYDKRISTSDFIDVERTLFANNYFDDEITGYARPSLSPVVEILARARNGELSEQQVDDQLNTLRNYDVRNDLLKHFYRRSVEQQYALNLSGSSDRSSFYTSAGYDKATLNQTGNSHQRLSLNFQNTFQPIDRLQIDSRLTYTHSDNESNNTVGMIRMGGRNIYPYARFTDDLGNPVPINYDYSNDFLRETATQGFLPWQYNPIEELALTSSQSQQAHIRAAAGLRYEFTNWLNAEVKYQFEHQRAHTEVSHDARSYYARNLVNSYSQFDGTSVVGYNIPMGDILTMGDNTIRSHNGRFQLNARVARNNHSFVALAGAEVREIKGSGYSSRQYGYDPTLGSSAPVDFVSAFELYPTYAYTTIPNTNGVRGTVDRYRAYFANYAHTYMSRYTLSLSGRIDQSNLFGVQTNQKSAPLWSVGGKWIVSAENFYRLEKLPTLDLRITYGYNGNVDQNVTALTTAQFITAAYSQRNAAFLVSPPNPDLRWERTGMLNIGVDFGTRRNRLSGSIEYYRRKSTDLIGEGPMDPTKGFISFKGNIASLSGEGVDVQLNSINIDGLFKWKSNLMMNYVTDKVTRYDLRANSVFAYMQDASIGRISSDYVPVEGRPLFGIYSFRSAGLDPMTGDPRGYLNGEASTDITTIQSIATIDSIIYHGRATPPTFGALRNTIEYKGWSLSLNVTYRFGYFFRRPSVSYSDLYTSYRGHQDFANRWQQPGDEMSTTVPSMVYPLNSARDAFYLNAETHVEKGDNIRLQDLRIGYDFPELNVGNVTFNQIQIYGYINNLGILWRANRSGIDPDFLSMPLPRTYALGLRIGL